MGERPRYLSNSQLTSTTGRLSQNSIYQPDNYRDNYLNLDLEKLQTVSPNGLRKSVSFSDISNVKHFSEDDCSDSDSVDIELERLIDHDETDARKSPVRNDIQPMTQQQAEWFTAPRHLYENDYSTMGSVGIPARQVSHSRRPVGSIGAALADEKMRADQVNVGREIDHFSIRHPATMTTKDEYALKYFPYTFCGSASLKQSLEIPVPVNNTMSPSPKGLPRPITPTTDLYSMPKHKPKSKNKRSRPMSAQATYRSSGGTDMYLTSESPITASANVVVSTPYQEQLASLRMQRLRIEEEHLLEVKRHNELERTRGPKPKWYEATGPEFHYEAHKNNEMLKNKHNWQSTLNYRNELVSASKDFRRSFTSADFI